MSKEDAIKFYKAIDFLHMMREYFDRMNINYIDDFRNVEMWVRKGYYSENK